MSVPHRTSNATRGSMAATMDHSDIRGLGTALHLFLAGLPRSSVGDHRIGCPHRTFEDSPHRARASRCRFGGRISEKWSVVSLTVLGAAQRSSDERFDLACDVPDKAAQFTGDGHTDFILRQLTPHAQMSEAFGQTQLCVPGDVAYGFGLTLLAHLQTTADSGAVAIRPSRLDEHASSVLVAGLGDAALMAGLAGGELRGHQSQVSHQ